jgi:hypothetical protein
MSVPKMKFVQLYVRINLI